MKFRLVWPPPWSSTSSMPRLGGLRGFRRVGAFDRSKALMDGELGDRVLASSVAAILAKPSADRLWVALGGDEADVARRPAGGRTPRARRRATPSAAVGRRALVGCETDVPDGGTLPGHGVEFYHTATGRRVRTRGAGATLRHRIDGRFSVVSPKNVATAAVVTVRGSLTQAVPRRGRPQLLGSWSSNSAWIADPPVPRLSARCANDAELGAGSPSAATLVPSAARQRRRR